MKVWRQPVAVPWSLLFGLPSPAELAATPWSALKPHQPVHRHLSAVCAGHPAPAAAVAAVHAHL